MHRGQQIEKTNNIYYSGSIDRIDFSEEQETKGFMDVVLKKQGVDANFRSLTTRDFNTITIKIPEEIQDPNSYVLDHLNRIENLMDLIIRLEIEISNEQNNLLQRYKIIETLAIAFHHQGPKIITPELSDRRRIKGVTEETSLEEALVQYLTMLKIPQEKMNRILKRAKEFEITLEKEKE